MLKSEKKFAKELELLLKDDERLDEANSLIDQIVNELRNGFGDKKIRQTYSGGVIGVEGALEVAKSRLKVSEKFTRWNRLWLDSYSASYSTPEIIARYRSGRLSSTEIVDVGCGAGLQSIFFSEFNSVTSIEVSRVRSLMTRLNGLTYGFVPKKVVNADYAAVIDKVPVNDETVVFSDPLRPRTEEERTLNTLIPSPVVVHGMLARKTDRFVFDLPPQMKWENISLPGEKEYISIGSRMNRLTLYTGSLSNGQSSAVMMPEMIRITGEPSEPDFSHSDKAGSMLFVPDISLKYSRLLGVLKELGDFREISIDQRRTVLTSDSPPNGFFPGEVFNVEGSTGSELLSRELKKAGAGKVIPRFSIDPDRYYDMKRTFESGLTGSEDIYLFRRGEEFVLCRKDVSNSGRVISSQNMKHIVN